MHLDINISSNKYVFTDPIFVKHLYNAKWHLGNIANYPFHIIDEITLFSLVVPARHDNNFNNQLFSTKVIQQQEVAGSDTTKLPKKNGKLYFRGDISTPQAALKVLGTFFGILDLIYENVETNPPFVWVILQKIVDTLRNVHSGWQWIQSMASVNNIAVSPVLEFQILVATMIQFSKDHTMLNKLSHNKPISADNLDLVKFLSNNIMQRFQTAINNPKGETYVNPPKIYDYIVVKVKTQDITTEKNTDDIGLNTEDSNTTMKMKTMTKLTKKVSDPEKGFLILQKKAKEMPKSDGISVTQSKTGTLCKVCTFFVIRRRSCYFGDSCNKA